MKKPTTTNQHGFYVIIADYSDCRQYLCLDNPKAPTPALNFKPKANNNIAVFTKRDAETVFNQLLQSFNAEVFPQLQDVCKQINYPMNFHLPYRIEPSKNHISEFIPA